MLSHDPIGHDRPAALVLTRQNLPTLDRSQYSAASGVAGGGYVLIDTEHKTPQVILIGAGSELTLCVAAWQCLADQHIAARVVSMPCCELFDAQDQVYRDRVLPPDVTARVAVEAGVRMSWDRYLGHRGIFVGMNSFGASAPYQQLYEHFGITVEAVVKAAKSLL
jgi:transketolase